MYLAQIKKLADAYTLIEAVKKYLDDKIDNAGESDKSQERAVALSEVRYNLENVQNDLDAAKDELEGVE